jgi:pilus assembly protein CpaB
MRLDRRFGVLVTVSLLWGLLVAVGFYRLAGGVGRRTRAAEPEKPLVVAVAPLPLGAMIGRNAVKLRNVPVSLFPAGGFSRIEDVVDRPVISAIQPDEAVVEARIAARGSGLGLAPLIPPGMRALSVRVNDVVGVAGFLLPGMRVDVLVTGRPASAPDTITRTVLQDIAVLSAGQTVETDGKSPAITTPVVTLLVTPNDAEALTLATNEGHIQLVLRNSMDRQLTNTRGRELSGLFAPQRTETPAAGETAALPPRPKKQTTVVAPPQVPAPDRGAAATPAPPPPPNDGILMIRGNVKTLESASPKGREAQ